MSAFFTYLHIPVAVLQFASQTLIPFLHRRHRMQRRVLTLLAIALTLGISTLTLCESAFSQEHSEHPAGHKAKPAALMSGYGPWHHPVSTKNAQAQAFLRRPPPPSRKRRRSAPMLPRATRRTSPRLLSAFPPIPNPICTPPRNSIAMPCATS